MEMSSGPPMFIVDSFAAKPFEGNPAAVCLLPKEFPDDVLQKVAAEMNLCETAFVTLLNQGDSFNETKRFGLRWMTPVLEVPLCGHGTMAAAAVLFYCLETPHKELVFSTLSGDLTARRDGDFICLDLPLNPPQPYTNMDGIKELLKLVLTNPEMSLEEVQYSSLNGTFGFLVLVLKDHHTRAELEELKPKLDQMVESHTDGSIGAVIVTLKTAIATCDDKVAPKYDFVSRFFGPWAGVPEDPVTGAAHTVLASYWSHKLGKTTMYARQCSSRGGDLRLTVKDNNRLEVAGPATVILRGHLNSRCVNPSS